MASLSPNATGLPAATTGVPTGAPLPVMHSTYGAWLLGTYACLLFQGMVFHQTYRYFKLYPRDARYLKVWVVVVNVIEMVTTAMAGHAAYYYMVTHAFDPTVLLKDPVWTLIWLPIPGTLAAISVELFFARRLWLIDRRFKPVSVLAIVLNLGFFSCFAAMVILSAFQPDPSSFLKYSYLASVAAGLIGISDVTVTSCLIWVLHTRRTGIKETNSKIDLLIKYAVSTGLIICIFNVLNVIFSVMYPDNWIYVGISIAMTKLYANTFLVSLNARHSLMSSDVIYLEQTTGFGGTTGAGNTNGPNGSRSKFTHIAFATPSVFASGAPTSQTGGAGPVGAGSVIELKQMGIEGNESQLEVMEFKRPRGTVGAASV
ncbi:hypothetical protein OH76DRAFT_1470610 [Lentinus brumalis]|uniref:DUF6534 domain-containing protein n=1 Tax=Lentinus brumalis TaxID=2498619 RepID=A0A371DIJ7_9APHY|nr:hypothetical protein OH76DRAFT_1470610 [Polyporus brumalis]